MSWRWPLLLPVLLILGLALARVGADDPESAAPRAPAPQPASGAATGRIVFVMVDALAWRQVEDPEAFPVLWALRPRAMWGHLEGSLPASTVPCTRTMLEGSRAGYVAGLRNFSAALAGPGSFPHQAAAAGLRVAVASDHTFNKLFGDVSVASVHVERDRVPHLTRDHYVAAAALRWIRADVADVVLLHMLDVDKVSHVHYPGDPEYLEVVRETNAAIAKLLAALGPEDTLIVVGDHGHDHRGNHDTDTGYLALGPAFAPGRVDLAHPTVALLLAAAAGTPLPDTYEGEVPVSGLRVRVRGLGDPPDNEALAERVATLEAARAGESLAETWAFVPWLLGGLCLLAGALALTTPWPARRVGLWAVGALTVVAALDVLVGYTWGTVGRPLLWLGPPINLLHYSLLAAAVAALVGWLLRLFAGVVLTPALGTGLLLFPLLVHLPGKDYFSSTWGGVHLLFPATLLLLAPGLRRRSRAALLAVGAVAGFVLLARTPLAGWVDAGGPWTGLPLLLGLAVAFDPDRPLRQRWPRAAGIATLLVVLALAADEGWGRTATFASLALACGAVCRALDDEGPGHGWLHGVLAGALLVTLMFLELTELRFAQVRFSFGFRWSVPHTTEWIVAAQVSALALLKYTLLPMLVLLATPSLRDRSRPAAQVTLAVVVAAPALIAAWVVGARLDLSTRFQEVPMEEACLLGAWSLTIYGAWVLMDLGGLARRTAGWLATARSRGRRPPKA